MQRQIVMLILFVLCTSAEVYAGPGGQIAKGLFYTFWGRLLLGAIFVILFPLIAYVYIQERRAKKRAMSDLAVVARVDSNFDWLKVNRRIQDCFRRVHHAWNEGDVSEAAEWMTSWYWQNQQLVHLNAWKKRGLTNVCEVKTIGTIAPVLFVHRNEKGTPHQGSELIVSIEANMTDYLINQSTGKVEEGDKKPKDVSRIWTFVYEGGVWKVANIEEDSVSLTYAQMSKSLPSVQSTLRSAASEPSHGEAV